MNHDERDESKSTSDGVNSRIRRYWRPVVGALVPVIAVIVIVAFPDWLRMRASFVQAHLPLSLPVLMVAVSIGVRLHELREAKGWLGLCNRFAAGYVTFAIWALVSGESVKQYVWINSEKVLDKSFSVSLVVTAFGLLAVCSLVTVLAESETHEGGKRGWQTVQAMLVGVSLFALLFPYVLFEQKATVEARTGTSLEVQSFTVAIGYRDPTFNQYLGRSTNPILQCVILRSVAAKTSEQAREVALKSFLDSESSNQFVNPADRSRERPIRKVEHERTWVVVETDQAGVGGR